MSKNPFELKPRKKLKAGRRLGNKNSTIKYRQATIHLKESIYKKILEMTENKGSLTMKKIVNDILEKELLKTKENRNENTKSG